MELTRFDMQNQAIQRRIADALERIAEVLEQVLVESDKQWQTETSKNKT